MIASDDPELFDWLANARDVAGAFLSTLATTAFRADGENYPLIRPFLLQMKEKYPQYTEPSRRAY